MCVATIAAGTVEVDVLSINAVRADKSSCLCYNSLYLLTYVINTNNCSGSLCCLYGTQLFFNVKTKEHLFLCLNRNTALNLHY